MSLSASHPPPPPARLRGGFHWWGTRWGNVELRFLGRGPQLERAESLERIEPRAPPVAMLRQIHSARVLPAAPGPCGEGDALVTSERDLALSVIVADCVPLMLATPGALLAIHAGWRGLAAGVVGRAVAEIAEPATARAWIGPAIGPCCYEVAPEVAAEVVAAAGPSALAPGRGERPHLDLGAAVRSQLAAAGVEAIEELALCTRCHPDLLWSFRRDGARAGRNIAFIWRRAGPRGRRPGARR
jgi:polyphenol oxidase